MPRLATRILATAVALGALVGGAHADDTDYFKAGPDPRAVKFTAVGQRTTHQRLVIGGIALGAVLAGGVGLAFNLDSRSAANDVSAKPLSGRVWTRADQDTYDRAGRSGLYAGLCYGAGGLLLIGTLVAYWRTAPAEREVELRPGQPDPRPTPIVAPTPGGAIIGAGWSF